MGKIKHCEGTITVNRSEQAAWIEKFPLLEQIIGKQEVLWRNPLNGDSATGIAQTGITIADVKEASDRLKRFAPYIANVFPETAEANGIIESPITAIPKMKEALATYMTRSIPGEIVLKQDNALPISGSIKARGGIYEVLKHAETLALEHGLIKKDEDYTKFAEQEFRNLFAEA